MGCVSFSAPLFNATPNSRALLISLCLVGHQEGKNTTNQCSTMWMWQNCPYLEKFAESRHILGNPSAEGMEILEVLREGQFMSNGCPKNDHCVEKGSHHLRVIKGSSFFSFFSPILLIPLSFILTIICIYGWKA